MSSTESDKPEVDDTDFSGVILNSKYIPIAKLGYGSFSTVWLSYNINNKQFYAIKIQNIEDYVTGVEEVNIFKNLSRNNCDYFNKMVEDFVHKTEYGDHICMVLDLLAGSIYEVIKRGKYSNGLPINLVKKIVHQQLIALDVLHNKYKKIHTDIKPENILLVGVSNNVKIIISEFKKYNFDQMVQKKISKLNKKNTNLIQQDVANIIINDMIKKNIISSAYVNDLTDSDNSDTSNYSDSDNTSDSDNSVKTKTNNMDKDIDKDVVNDIYINEKNIITKLSDFGSCCNIDYKLYDIQTRYYRSPEILLNYPYNETCDLWSMGCVIYELLTGDILFNPIKRRGFSTDRSHIYDIQCKFGKIPEQLLNKSKKKKAFFKQNGLMKGSVYNFEFDPFIDRLVDKLKSDTNNNINNINNIVDLMVKMLNVDPFKRPNAKECLNHKLFK
jgi:serine/threonine-protein kinase SRPK3